MSFTTGLKFLDNFAQKPVLSESAQVAAKIAVTYIVFGILWITFSDRFLASISEDPDFLTRIQTYKGWAYVLLTGGLVFLLVRQYMKRILRASRQSEEARRYFEMLFEAAPDAVMIHDTDGKFVSVNEKTFERLGYTDEEFRDMTHADIDHPDFAHLVPDRMKTIFEQGSLVFESAHRSKDGKVMPVEISSRVIEYGGSTAILSNCRDISGRKRAERSLKESEEKFRTIFENAPMGIALLDPDGHFLRANEYICRFLGRTESQVVGSSFIEFTYPEDVAKCHKEVAAVLNGEKDSLTIEKRYCRSGGETVWGFVTACLRRNDFGDPQYFIAQVLDISERKRAEEQRRQLQDRLDRARRMESLGILAGGVAHDLNNMLGPLVGYPELIMQDMPDDSPTRNQLKKMANSALEAAEVIQDLLTLARRGRYEMTPLNINRVIRSYFESPAYSRFAESRADIEVKLELDSAVDNISGSAAHLSKVVMNLVVNAFDAMADGGELTVRTGMTHLLRLRGGFPRVPEGDYVELSVRDTGTGIAEEDLPKIFEPYYSKKKMGRSGSGLGLSVVYGILKDHKGFYDVVSSSKGTEFILYFPTTTDNVTEAVEDSNSWRGTERLLVVDDSPEQRELAAELLGSLGYQVNTVDNGHAALSYLEHKEADLVILDMIMETDFDGLDTYREILKLRPQQKCIVVSGFSATQRVNEMKRLGVARYVRKPYTRDSLARVVREMLDETSQPIAT